MENYKLYKIKPGKREQWLSWCSKLMNDFYTEASETLREEQLAKEICVLFGEGDNTYVVYHHEPFPGAGKLPAVMERDLNKEHFRNCSECLEPVKPRILGYEVNS